MMRYSIMLLFLVMSGNSLFAVTSSDSAESLRKHIVDAYGAQFFNDIDAFKYTFNIQVGDRHIQRAWMWEPRTGSVSYQGKGPGGLTITHSYIHSKTDTSDTTEYGYVDQRFINDNYWLFFPFHLAWDSNMVISMDGPTSQFKKMHTRRLMVVYTSGGYSPGDSYELFSDTEGLLTWWVFRRGGKADQGSAMTWETHLRAGPIILTTEHWNQDRSFHLWFSDIAIRLHGSDKWIDVK